MKIVCKKSAREAKILVRKGSANHEHRRDLCRLLQIHLCYRLVLLHGLLWVVRRLMRSKSEISV